MSRANASVTSSTLAQPVGSQARGSILTRAAQGVRQLFFTAADLKDPEKLYEALSRMQTNLVTALRSLSENPTLGGNLVTGLVFAAGQTLNVSHGLGRAYRGWYVVRARGSAWSGYEAALPPSVKSDRMIALISANAGTYDIMVY